MICGTDILTRLPPEQSAVIATLVARASATWRFALVGGAVRDAMLCREPHDLDFVVQGAGSADEIAEWLGTPADGRTRFGGCRAMIDGVAVDAWRCEDHRICEGPCFNVESIVCRVTFNADRGLVSLDERDTRYVDAGMMDAISSKTLELEDKRGLAEELVVARAAYMLRKYTDWSAGPRLRELTSCASARLIEVFAGRVQRGEVMTADEARRLILGTA